MPAVVQKMMSDGVVTTDSKGFSILELGPDADSPEKQPAAKAPDSAPDPRAAMMGMLAKRGGGGEDAGGGGGGGGGGGDTTVQLKDCRKFGKYFKMLKVGLPPPAVLQKMIADGAVASESKGQAILDMGGDADSPELQPSANKPAAAAPALPAEVPIKDHPNYTKYFKMLKVGLDKDNVKFKMEQDGMNPDMLDRDPNSMVPSGDEPIGDGKDDEAVPLSYHPKYGKYFRMLSVRLPKDAIKAKMLQDGLDPTFLDKSPLVLVPRGPLNPKREVKVADEPENDGVTLAEHPMYGKYFKMLRVGLPAEAVKGKMVQEGADPDLLDHDPNEIAPQPEKAKKNAGRIKSQRVKSARIKSVHTALTALGAGAKGGPKVRKKKLYWKALDESKVGGDDGLREESTMGCEGFYIIIECDLYVSHTTDRPYHVTIILVYSYYTLIDVYHTDRLGGTPFGPRKTMTSHWTRQSSTFSSWRRECFSLSICVFLSPSLCCLLICMRRRCIEFCPQ